MSKGAHTMMSTRPSVPAPLRSEVKTTTSYSEDPLALGKSATCELGVTQSFR